MEKTKQQKARGQWKLVVVILICAMPLIASYFTYYVIKPDGRTNYGHLIDPRAYPIPAALVARTLEGEPVKLDVYKGKWIMLIVNNTDCAEPCRKYLYGMRQLRLAQGKDMERIERLWLISDEKPLDTMLIREYDGTHMLRVKPETVRQWLPVEAGAALSDYIFLVDPLGNLMMRFPKDADLNRIKKDLARLLKASRIG